jgi:hypothetical protein
LNIKLVSRHSSFASANCHNLLWYKKLFTSHSSLNFRDSIPKSSWELSLSCAACAKTKLSINFYHFFNCKAIAPECLTYASTEPVHYGSVASLAALKKLAA